MGHHRGERNQSLDAAETLRQRAKLDVIQQAPRGIQRTDIEGKHRARSFLLATGHLVVWMRRQAGVENFLDFWMSVEMARHGDAVGVVLERANRQRLVAARNEAVT